MAISKSTGCTASKRYLATLCEKTFLGLWSYPNVWRDQRIAKGEGKEVCDLLVVCGQEVVIFSDKSCGFPNTGDVGTDWGRWFRRSIWDSARQIYGAERWIRQFPKRLFLDRACTNEFPLDLGDTGQLRFHRVVVALNAGERCKREVGGSGSLFIYPAIDGIEHFTPNDPNFAIFNVGQINPTKGFVHVFDDVTLSIILRELDTVSDFVSYLSKKEAFVEEGKLYFSAGEENLLGVYLKEINERSEHDFILPSDYAHMLVRADVWSDLQTRPEFIYKKKNDRISYLWDSIIQTFSRHQMSDSLLPYGERRIAENEGVLRIMARENRLSRRILSMAFMGVAKGALPDKVAFRSTVSYNRNDVAYVFGIFPPSIPGVSHDQYRSGRALFLNSYCKVFAWIKKQYKTIVGIATESGPNSGRSYDLTYVSVEKWTAELEAEARDIQIERGFFSDQRTETHVHGSEYGNDGKPAIVGESALLF